MGYFDGIAANYFKTDGEGRHVFFPWGILGSGYLVPTDAEYERLRATLVRMWTECSKASVGVGLLGNLSSVKVLQPAALGLSRATTELKAVA
jgi:hypothetical protein